MASPAHAQPKVALMPGVTYEQGVQFTTHGPVAFHVLIAPRPDGSLYAIKPVLSNETILGRERVTAMQKRYVQTATVAGVNGDLFNSKDGHPTGALLRGGVLDHPPSPDRSSIGIDSGGFLRVDRLKFFGIWRGIGPRRTLNGFNQPAAANQVVLFTPSYGTSTPAAPGSVEAVITPFGPTVPNADLTGTVVELRQGGRTPIPAGGAVLVARGSAAEKLALEGPVGTPITTRLILQPDWTGVVDALGGGPVIVREGKPIFRSLEIFTVEQLQLRHPRTAVGQLADGRFIFLAVDGRKPGYSTGMTNFELAQTMVRLGALTASAMDAGGSTTMAFEGKVLNQPSDPGGERSVAESLNVFYYGAYAPAVEPAVLSPNGDDVDETATLSYKLVRPSAVSATLSGPGGATISLDQSLAGELRPPATYPFDWDGTDPLTGQPAPEGRWTWTVTATDDRGIPSTATRMFSLNRTLSRLTVAPALLKLPPGGASLTATFSLAAPARGVLRIETPDGAILRTISQPGLQAGVQSISWDGLLAGGTRVHSGRYVAQVFASNRFGIANLATTFVVRRVEPPRPKPPPSRD
jgi:exopolysaccharide biosynthesis protein